MGYEIGPRVGLCMGQEHIGQGWHSGATVGVFSAVAGAANLLELTPEETLHAIGIAGTQSSGLMAAQFGAMVKRMHAGKSAHSGLLAALLARRVLRVSLMFLRRLTVDSVPHFLDRRIVSI